MDPTRRAKPIVAAGEVNPTIDILPKPDAAMLPHSVADNERLLSLFPKGFALNARHRAKPNQTHP